MLPCHMKFRSLLSIHLHSTYWCLVRDDKTQKLFTQLCRTYLQTQDVFEETNSFHHLFLPRSRTVPSYTVPSQADNPPHTFHGAALHFRTPQVIRSASPQQIISLTRSNESREVGVRQVIQNKFSHWPIQVKTILSRNRGRHGLLSL